VRSVVGDTGFEPVTSTV